MARLIDADKLIERTRAHRQRIAYVESFIQDIREAPTVNGWISVEDELPENQERVVARLSDTENIVCCFYSPDKWWDIEGMWRLKRPTHWMPVIVYEPPEEVKYTWPD